MKVESSQIAEIDWDAKTQMLTVKFQYQNRIHVYANVPEEVWKQFQHSISKGSFFHKWIKPNFHQARVH
jgi:hypothetical protein